MFKTTFVSAAATASISLGASGEVLASWSIAYPANDGGPIIGSGYVDYGQADAGLAPVSFLEETHLGSDGTFNTNATIWTQDGNGSDYSLAGDHWHAGDYYTVSVWAVGYENITLQWGHARSSSGPSSFSVDLSTDLELSWVTSYPPITILEAGAGGTDPWIYPGPYQTASRTP